MDDIRNLILDRAKERMERFGYKKTTMDEIGRDCRISKKTIYEHFAGKEDMFKSLVIREHDRALELLLEQVEAVADPQERLILLIRRAVAYLNQDHFVTRILVDDDLYQAFVNRRIHEIIDEKITAIIAAIIREGKGQGRFREVNETIFAYAGYKLFQAFSFARTGPLRQAQNEEEYTEILIDFIINTLVKKPG